MSYYNNYESEEIMNEKLSIYADIRANQPSNKIILKKETKPVSKWKIVDAISLISTLGPCSIIINNGRNNLCETIKRRINKQQLIGKGYEEIIEIIIANGFTKEEAKIFIESEYHIDTDITSIESIETARQYSTEIKSKGITR